jgi:hypothetical protein
MAWGSTNAALPNKHIKPRKQASKQASTQASKQASKQAILSA